MKVSSSVWCFAGVFVSAVFATPDTGCLMLHYHGLCDSGEACPKDEGWRCLDTDGTMYFVSGLPNDFETKNKMKSGSTVLSVGNGATKRKDNGRNTFNVHPGALVSLENVPESVAQKWGKAKSLRGGKPRELATQVSGDSNILVVRVTDIAGNAPPNTAEELSDKIFGTLSDTANMKSQLEACSGGSLRIFPATGNDIVNGVVEITVPSDSTGINRFEVEDWVDEAMDIQYPNWRSDYTHTMYVLSPVVDFEGAAAYAYLNGKVSVYNGVKATSILVQIHEIGHNLNLGHSGAGTKPYGDASGYMGNAAQVDDYPRMCFNAAKSWALGWYSRTGKDGHWTLPIGESWNGHLVGIDDYLNGEFVDGKHRVILHLPSANPSYENMYIMYNRKEGVNEEVVRNGETVTIVSTAGMNKQSWLEAAMTPSDDAKRFTNWDGDGNDLVIEVCEFVFGTPDFAHVVVSIDDGSQSEFGCMAASPTDMPSQSPSQSTLVPTKFPSMLPTSMSSEQPTNIPTNLPSRNPTDAPSKTLKDTSEPTFVSTNAPSNAQSDVPTSTPTQAPSNGSSISPSSVPTKSPTMVPTQSPSLFPSQTPSDGPTMTPTQTPSNGSSHSPSNVPTKSPTMVPSQAPSSFPSQTPSDMASSTPTSQPSLKSSSSPTVSPSVSPTELQTDAPSQSPTEDFRGWRRFWRRFFGRF